jgi:hypothetical protein
MRDETSDAWAAYDRVVRRLLALEEIAERLAVTSVDPIAIDDWHVWKTGGISPTSS